LCFDLLPSVELKPFTNMFVLRCPFW
jgi:hypothetical protein